MARSYCSMRLDKPASEVWAVIRPFGHYEWAEVEGETIIEDGKAADQVSSIRRATTGGKVLRQVLLAHSDVERSYMYAFCGPPPFPVRDYVATIRVTPVAETDASFVEWWATFDCASDQREHWITFFEKDGFARWLAALRRFIAARDPQAAPRPE